MKNQEKTLDQRPWAAGCYITVTGLVLSKQHVMTVMSLDRAKAALMTTAIIQRIIQP